MKVIKLQDIKQFIIDNRIVSLWLVEKFDELEVIETDEIYSYKEWYEFAIRQVYSALEQVTK